MTNLGHLSSYLQVERIVLLVIHIIGVIGIVSLIHKFHSTIEFSCQRFCPLLFPHNDASTCPRARRTDRRWMLTTPFKCSPPG